MSWCILKSDIPAGAPASAGGLFLALRGRCPLALELARPAQDSGFQIGLDLSLDRGLDPVAVSEARLARHRDRYRIRVQGSCEDENVDPVAFVRLAAGRVPFGDQRTGERILRGEFDKIQRVEGGLPENRANRAAGL